VILEVNRKPAQSASQFATEMHQNANGKDILLLVWSKGNSSYAPSMPTRTIAGNFLLEQR